MRAAKESSLALKGTHKLRKRHLWCHDRLQHPAPHIMNVKVVLLRATICCQTAAGQPLSLT
eukprot:2461152-Amphidinium_carterae.2